MLRSWAKLPQSQGFSDFQDTSGAAYVGLANALPGQQACRLGLSRTPASSCTGHGTVANNLASLWKWNGTGAKVTCDGA